jgi:hypothetical protein
VRRIRGVGAVAVGLATLVGIVAFAVVPRLGDGDPGPPPTAAIDGPAEVARGVPVTWTVRSAGATGGRWDLHCTLDVPVADPVWHPGNSFTGSFGVPNSCVLGLTVDGTRQRTARATKRFTVT